MAETLEFIDLFAGLGGFHRALGDELGHECVFASEIESDLQDLYKKNFRGAASYLHGDITKVRDKVPRHDILCGGFPCPTFSKSGKRNGLRENRGKLMREIIRIAANRRPAYIFLENVGNFERIGAGGPWTELKTSLESIGYHVRATEHRVSGGHGLISPHHLGHPHQRERFYVVATLDKIATDPFPNRQFGKATTLNTIVEKEPNSVDLAESQLSEKQVRAINYWNRVIKSIPRANPIVSPLWGDEAWEKYPYEGLTPWATPGSEVRQIVGVRRYPEYLSKQAFMKTLPRYAQSKVRRFPLWKVGFIQDSRTWFAKNKRYFWKDWKLELQDFPPSLRKLEWNCGDETRDLWTKVLQFRPSGLRAKRYHASPALVAMTATQIPILGPERRYLTRTEGLRLQGFPDNHKLPNSRIRSFAALGNAVHVGVVTEIVRAVLANPGLITSRHSIKKEIEPKMEIVEA